MGYDVSRDRIGYVLIGREGRDCYAWMRLVGDNFRVGSFCGIVERRGEESSVC